MLNVRLELYHSKIPWSKIVYANHSIAYFLISEKMPQFTKCNFPYYILFIPIFILVFCYFILLSDYYFIRIFEIFITVGLFWSRNLHSIFYARECVLLTNHLIRTGIDIVYSTTDNVCSWTKSIEKRNFVWPFYLKVSNNEWKNE